MKYKIIIGILTFLFCGCEKENNPCEIAKEGENYLLSDTAKTYVINYHNAKKVVFKTMDGNEISFDIIGKETNASYQVVFPCEVDPFQRQILNGTSQILTYSLINNWVISEPIEVNILEFPATPNRQSQETLVVSLGEAFSNSFETADHLFYYVVNSNNFHLNYLDSLSLGGKTFYSVYEMNKGEQKKLELKYTVDQGIIYIKNPSNLKEYIYERKE